MRKLRQKVLLCSYVSQAPDLRAPEINFDQLSSNISCSPVSDFRATFVVCYSKLEGQ